MEQPPQVSTTPHSVAAVVHGHGQISTDAEGKQPNAHRRVNDGANAASRKTATWQRFDCQTPASTVAHTWVLHSSCFVLFASSHSNPPFWAATPSRLNVWMPPPHVCVHSYSMTHSVYWQSTLQDSTLQAAFLVLGPVQGLPPSASKIAFGRYSFMYPPPQSLVQGEGGPQSVHSQLMGQA